jgi:hypothetical protein
MAKNEMTKKQLQDQVSYLSTELRYIIDSRAWSRFVWVAGLLRSNPLKVFCRRVGEFFDDFRLLKRVKHDLQGLEVHPAIDIGSQQHAFYGNHRSGWRYAVSAISLLSRPGCLYLDTFIERTFGWASGRGSVHLKEWIGISHVPPQLPHWLPFAQRRQAFEEFSKTPSWQISIARCKGLFTLSETNAVRLRKLVDIPVCSLFHPTEIPSIQWSVAAFKANRHRTVVQIGWWLRNLHAFYAADFPGYQKVLLQVTSREWLKDYLTLERANVPQGIAIDEKMYATVDTMPFLDNRSYDHLLSRSIVFLNLFDSSANNAIIECIARGTPLLVNPLPSVVEYLGPSYPLYYTSLEEASLKVSNLSLLEAANLYLRKESIREKLSPRFFLESITSSEIYKSIGTASS